MRRSNFALRLQPSLLEELRKAAELEGVALNGSSMWQWRKRFLLCVPRSIFGKGVAVAIAPKPCGFSNVLEKGTLRKGRTSTGVPEEARPESGEWERFGQ